MRCSSLLFLSTMAGRPIFMIGADLAATKAGALHLTPRHRPQSATGAPDLTWNADFPSSCPAPFRGESWRRGFPDRRIAEKGRSMVREGDFPKLEVRQDAEVLRRWSADTDGVGPTRGNLDGSADLPATGR